MLVLRSAALFVAFSCALSGCTIVTYSDPPPPPPPPPNRPRPQPQLARPVTPTPVAPAPIAAHPPVAPPALPRTPARPTGFTPPTITTPVAFGNGQAGAFEGRVYVLPANPTKVPTFDAMVPFARLFTDSFDVAPQAFSGDFPGALLGQDAFAIHYDGQFAVPSEEVLTFRLTSDDGAILSIDGAKLIDLDGSHPPKTASAEKRMSAGSHTLTLDYFQARKGEVALKLELVNGAEAHPLVGLRR